MIKQLAPNDAKPIAQNFIDQIEEGIPVGKSSFVPGASTLRVATQAVIRTKAGEKKVALIGTLHESEIASWRFEDGYALPIVKEIGQGTVAEKEFIKRSMRDGIYADLAQLPQL